MSLEFNGLEASKDVFKRFFCVDLAVAVGLVSEELIRKMKKRTAKIFDECYRYTFKTDHHIQILN